MAQPNKKLTHQERVWKRLRYQHRKDLKTPGALASLGCISGSFSEWREMKLKKRAERFGNNEKK